MARRSPRRSRSAWSGSARRSRPSKRMWPVTFAVRLGKRPITARKVTLLPEPDSPTTPSVRPRATPSETPSTARVTRPASPRKLTLRSEISSSVGIACTSLAKHPALCKRDAHAGRRRGLDAWAKSPARWVQVEASVQAILPLPARRIALHAARVGGGAAAAAIAGGGGEAAFRPGGAGLDDVAAASKLVAGRGGHAAFDDEHARARGARPERDGEMLGVPGGRVDRLLQVHAGVHVAQEELRGPLVLLIAAGRAPGEIRLAVAQRERGRERRARTLARRQRAGMILIEPEHLPAGAEAESELGDHRRGLQPAARRRRRDHIAGLVDDVEMHRVARDLAELAHRGLACPHGADRGPCAVGALELDDGAEALDRAGQQ